MGFADELIVMPPGMVSLDLLDIHCPICKDVLEDPRMVPGCEHIHCKSCAESAMINPPLSCPTCRTLVPSMDSLLLAPRILRNLLDKFRIKCSFSPVGCPSQPLSLSIVRRHETNCEHNPANLPKPCTRGCGLIVPKDFQSGHNCVTSLRTEMDRLRAVVTELSLEQNDGRQVVKQGIVRNAADMPQDVFKVFKPFTAAGHHWRFQYSCLKLAGQKWFGLYLFCVGPINRDVSLWTVQLNSNVELRLKAVTCTANDAVYALAKDRVFGPVSTQNIRQAWGFSKFMEWEQLIRPGRFLAPDGSITLEVVFPANMQIVTT